MIRKTRTLLGAAVIAGSMLLAGCQTGAAATDAFMTTPRRRACELDLIRMKSKA